MSTKRRITKKTIVTNTVVDHDGHDIPEIVIEEVLPPRLPQVYQATVFSKKGGPHEPMELVGHLQYSETTGLIRSIPSPKYDSDLNNFSESGIVVRGVTDNIFSPGTIGWIKNLHKAELPRYWVIDEAGSMNEV